MNEEHYSSSPQSAWPGSGSGRLQTPAKFGSTFSNTHYRTPSNVSIKSNNTLNSFYNVNSTSHSLKPFSSMLPYRVIEALSASNLALKNLMAKISESGWAWLVSGRRLFVWRYIEDGISSQVNRPSKASKCYELLLPPSDIAHKADLICVMCPFEQKSKFPSALAVSPEGSIRYWPNISQEGNSIDSIVVADLQGQECLTLVDIQPLGCILGTTTNSLVHICLESAHGDHGQSPIQCRILKAPQGILSGISRRVSSLIFGSLPTTHSSESKQLIRIVRNKLSSTVDDLVPLYILVLSNFVVQKWIISDYNIENLSGEIDLERHVKESFISKLWNRSTTHHNQLTAWPIDISLNGPDSVVLMAGCSNADIPNESFVGIFTLSTEIFDSASLDGTLNSQQQSESHIFKSFKLVRNISITSDNNDALQPDSSSNGSLFASNYRAFNIIPGGTDDDRICYIYNSSKIYQINLYSDNDSEDTGTEIDFKLSDDYLLSAILFNQSPLLFTYKNGFVTIHSNLPDSISNKQLSNLDREFVIANNSDKFSVLKRALALYLKGEKSRANLMIQELFPSISGDHPHSSTSSELDDVVCAVSADILDQIPVADPRWAHLSNSDYDNSNSTEDVNSVNYVIITNQLEEKFATHRLFIEFLQSSSAWDALTALATSVSILPTKLILCEHTEKLILCLHLRKLHVKYGKLLEVIIRKVLEKRKSCSKNLLNQSHLTYQDIFYREVTKIDDLFWAFVEFEESHLNVEHANSNESLQLVVSITDITTSVFAEVCLYRQSNGAIYQSAAFADCDYVPWSSSKHISGVREPLLKQFDFLVKCTGADQNIQIDANEENKYSIIGQKIADLADIILDSYVCQLSYLNSSNQKYSTLKAAFQTNRYKCLMPLMHLKQYERAASLAEKYEDFDILIKICEELNNQQQLQQYVQQFASKGFSEYLFDWYLKEGKQGKMLATVSNNYKLADYLSNHESLNWLHQIHLNQFKEASTTLKRLGSIEEMYPGRKKTLLSIGKLALIASGNSDYSDFDDQIKFINYQESLSDFLLQKNGLDKKTIKVLSPEQLVDILTSGVEGPNEEITNFQKALEICEIVEKRNSAELYPQLNLKIWLKAFQKDDWINCSTDNFEIPIKQSFFYQLATAYFVDEPKKIPQIDSLMAAFQGLPKSEKINFFIRATYELLLH